MLLLYLFHCAILEVLLKKIRGENKQSHFFSPDLSLDMLVCFACKTQQYKSKILVKDLSVQYTGFLKSDITKLKYLRF